MTSYAAVTNRFMAQSIEAAKQTAANKMAMMSLSPELSAPECREFHVVDKNGWSGSLQDTLGMDAVFDTSDLGSLMTQVLTSEERGVTGDIMAITLQGDRLASEKRAFRDRHCSWIRRSTHAAGRQSAYSKDVGIHSRNVLGYIENILKATKGAQ